MILPTDYRALLQHRLRASFRQNENIGLAWGQSVIYARQAMEGLEALGWTEAEITFARHELCRAVMATGAAEQS